MSEFRRRLLQQAEQSESGKYQLIAYDGGLALSTDYGQTWKNVLRDMTYKRVRVSRNGQYMAACGLDIKEYRYSVNFGKTWQSGTGVSLISHIDLSPDGLTIALLMANSRGPLIDLLKWDSESYKTIDRQNIQTKSRVSGSGVAITNNGELITWMFDDGRFGSRIFRSENLQQAVEIKQPGGDWNTVSMSDDGMYQISGDWEGKSQMLISSNYGKTWKIQETGLEYNTFTSMGMSATGQYIVAAARKMNGPKPKSPIISNDYGKTYHVCQQLIDHRYSGLYYGVGISGDGKYITVASEEGNIFVSNDFGETFNYMAELNTNGEVFEVAIN